jgi:hypothetical protein
LIFFHGGAVGGGGKRSGLGKDFSGLLAYLYEGDLEVGLEEGFERGKAREERVEWISSRNIPRCADLSDWRAASRHFTTVHGRTQQPVYHVGIALEPGVSLSREQWEKSVDRLLAGLGLEDHRVLVVAHKDSAHEHVHLVVHRVNVLTERIWQPSFDGKKAAVVLRGLEREFGLRELGIEASPALQLTSGEHQVAKSAELPPLASRARAEVLVDFQESGSWGELVGRLGAKGYGLEPASRGGGVVLVGSEGLRVSISRLDGDLSGPKLARRYGETLGQYLEGQEQGVEVSRVQRAFVVPETGRLADELGSRYATWTRGDAMRELSGQAGRDELVAALVSSPHVVKLPSQPGRAERFASVSYLAQELSVFDAAKALAASKDHPRGHAVEVIDGATARERAEGAAAAAQARRQGIEGRLSADLEQAKGELVAARESLAQAVGRVYASPDAVMAHLERWSQIDRGAGMGNLEKISPLRGRERALLGPDAERQEAVSRLPEVEPAYRALVRAHGKEIGELEEGLARVRASGAGQEAFGASRANRLVDGLSSEPRAALEQVAGGGGLGLVVGRAGSGKTALAAAIGAVHEEAGYRVLGASMAAKAARGLEEASGIPSSTVASLVARIDAGKVSLGRTTLLVVDEAGILDTSQLAGLLDRAAAAGSKVVLMGDPDQLQPIGAGAPFRGLLAEHAHVELGEIRRQRDPEQASLVGGLARARVEEALVAHDAAGRLVWHGNVSGAREAMADRWISAGEQERPLLVAYRRQDVAELNRLVQERRIAAGELGGRVGEGELRVGDQVVFERNGVVEFGERVQNGVVGRLEGVSGSHLRISIEGRGEVEVDPRLYRGLELGYALSLHRSQGQTSERVEVLADALMDRHGAYVALSRHREEVRLHVPVALGASSASDGQLLEGAAVEGRLQLVSGRGVDVRSLSGADRESFGRGVVEVDRGSLVSGLAERLSVSRSKGLAKDYGGELDYGGIVKAREDVREAIAEAEAAIRGAALRERQAAYYAEALPAARSEVESKRAELAKVVAKVYADPAMVMGKLEARAERSTEGLWRGEAERWLGELRGRERRLLGPDQARVEAVAALPGVSRAFDRLLEARRELRELEGSFKGFEAREGPVAAPGVGSAVAGVAAGVSAARSAVSLGKSLVESPDQAAVSAALVAANAVSPVAGRVAGVAAGVSQANSPESAFVTATLGLGKMALSQSVVMLPPGLRSVATIGLGVLGRVISVAGPER